MTDEEVLPQRPYGVNGGEHRFDLVVGQRGAKFRHAKWKVLTQFERDRLLSWRAQPLPENDKRTDCLWRIPLVSVYPHGEARGRT